MFRKVLPLAALAAISLGSAIASPGPEWIRVPDNDEGATFVDFESVTKAGSAVAVRVLRTYDTEMALGTDPGNGEEMYPHRSVKVRYLVECKTGRVALDSWEMFTGNLGDGKVVWADQTRGERWFYKAGTPEEKYALAVACARAAAQNQAG